MNKLCFAAADGIDYVESLSLIKPVGFDGYFTGPYIACDIDRMRAMKETGDSLGLFCETSHSFMSGSVTIWEEGSKGDDYIELLKGNIDNCVELSIPILVVHIKPDPEGAPCFERGIERLKKLIAYAAEKNIKIAFENINNEQYLIKTLDVFKEPHVGFCLDVGHESCNTPGVNFLPQIGDRLFCTHIHDNDLIHDEHRIPFDGKIDFERICRQLKECGYKGNITIEVKYSEYYKSKFSKEDFVLRAFEAAKKLKSMME